MGYLEITPDVFWVGVQDPDLRLFDVVMYTERGTSYNAYLVKGSEKLALIDTVKEKFVDTYIQELKVLIGDTPIDYLIVNHSEPDHAGSIERIIKEYPDIKVVTTYTAFTFLKEIVNHDFAVELLPLKEPLDLGGKTLKFIGASFLHWPDTIYTYLPEENILFSCDSFGCHYSDPRLFHDLIEEDITDVYKYYFDMIMSPFKSYMRNTLDRIEKLDINMICPGHGPILRSDLEHHLDLHRQWSAESENESSTPSKILLVYASAYAYTQSIAEHIILGIQEEGEFNIKAFDLSEVSAETALKELPGSSGLIVGSPTINKDALPNIWEFLIKISPLETYALLGAAFGSYGWSGEAVPNMESRLRMLRMKILPGLRVHFKPAPKDLQQAMDFGRNYARALKGQEDLLEDFLSYQISVNPHNKARCNVEDFQKAYKNDDIIVYWRPDQCSHDTNCFMSLPKAFNPNKRPWVDLDGAKAEEIIKIINQCPSGSLKYDFPESSKINIEAVKGQGWIKI